jgi:acetyl-CoA acyltransferase 1
MLRATIPLMQIPPSLIQEIAVGTVLPKGAAYEARAAALAAGFPETTPTLVVNRFCSSGLMAVTSVANQIRAGQIEVGLAVGVESMSFKCVSFSFRSCSCWPLPGPGRVGGYNADECAQ